MSSLDKIKQKIIQIDDLERWSKEIRPNIKKLVFTNGCFDIIHRGHVTYLAQAADFGDKFIVALNTDQSVSRLKGESRPIQDEQTRALIMASLECVDYVCFFNEDTPLNIIKILLPNVLIKGGDYEVDKIVGYKEVISSGGEVLTIDFVPGFSTTSILNLLSS